MLAFLISPVGRLFAGVAAGALLLGLVYTKGHGDGSGAEKKAEAVREAAAAVIAAKQTAQAAQISTQAQTQLATTQATNDTRTKANIQRVPQYVTAKADSACRVPVGFVSLFNAAASGQTLPAATSGPQDASSGLALSAVSSTITADFGIAYDWRAEAMTWRTWYADQAAAWNKH